jgi:hypothetical protein
MLWNEEDRAGADSNWHCNCSVRAPHNRFMDCEYDGKDQILAVLRLKTVLPLKEMNTMTSRLDRFDVCR